LGGQIAYINHRKGAWPDVACQEKSSKNRQRLKLR
jgi:hypothetical protein